MRLTIWDTAGQERYHALNANFYRGSDGRSLDGFRHLSQIHNISTSAALSPENCPIPLLIRN